MIYKLFQKQGKTHTYELSSDTLSTAEANKNSRQTLLVLKLYITSPLQYTIRVDIVSDKFSVDSLRARYQEEERYVYI